MSNRNALRDNVFKLDDYRHDVQRLLRDNGVMPDDHEEYPDVANRLNAARMELELAYGDES
jgi:hypothetical protein